VTIDCVEVTKLIFQPTLETVEPLLVELRVKRVFKEKKTFPGKPKTVP
jgi:hypothetical protein